MKLVRLAGQIINIDEISNREVRKSGIMLTFSNGDEMEVGWRDEGEKKEMLQLLMPGSFAAKGSIESEIIQSKGPATQE